MTRIIWTCWFQGRDHAPFLVRQCLESWERLNPDWEVRCLDRYNLLSYAPSLSEFDLEDRAITAASLSDIARIALLHEYGGVWVDATLFCNQPLDSWLPACMEEGFFAFDRPDRPLASWFLAAEPGNPVIAAWAEAVEDYWRDRVQADNYFWFHELFRAICAGEPAIAESWARVPRISALPPHQIQELGMLSPASDTAPLVDRSLPLFKLTYRYPEDQAGEDCLLHWLIGQPTDVPAPAPAQDEALAPLSPIASIKVGTENLGDHVQIIAGQRLLARFGLKPDLHVDRDRELADPPPPSLNGDEGQVPILLNGWFKSGNEGWPPHPRFDPIFLGFHIRLFQSPALASEESLAYYADRGPIGCRDVYTNDLLSGLGTESFISNCLSLTLPRRMPKESQTKTFVVSRDDRLSQAMPAEIGPFEAVLHYSGDTDFWRNMERAEALLARYRDEAKLIVTSLLHCALPAIAMGIPVVMVYPINTPAGRESDMERFSSLAQLLPIHEIEALDAIDWALALPAPGPIKLALIDQLAAALDRRGLARRRAVGPIAPSSVLPPA